MINKIIIHNDFKNKDLIDYLKLSTFINKLNNCQEGEIKDWDLDFFNKGYLGEVQGKKNKKSLVLYFYNDRKINSEN